MISFELWGPTSPEWHLFQDFSIKGAGKFASLFRHLPWPFVICKWKPPGISLEAQWSGPGASTAGSMGLTPGQGTKTPQAARHDQNTKQMKNSWLPVSQLAFISITKISAFSVQTIHWLISVPVPIIWFRFSWPLIYKLWDLSLSLHFLPSYLAS